MIWVLAWIAGAVLLAPFFRGKGDPDLRWVIQAALWPVWLALALCVVGAIAITEFLDWLFPA